MRLIGLFVLAVGLLGCRQLLGFDPVTQEPSDGTPDVVPDAGPCEQLVSTCVTEALLRQCIELGALPIDTTCAWGCNEAGGAHCAALQPSGGAVTEADLVPTPGLVIAVLATAGGTIDTNTGSITGSRGPGVGLVDGIEFTIRNSVGIFRFQKLDVTTAFDVRGNNAVALVALDGITIGERLDARGNCEGTAAGPGGFQGGAPAVNPGGGPSGIGVLDDTSGGGGGGSGAGGGTGGGGFTVATTPGGTAFGDATISVLRGGGGGGDGGNASGTGGGGGGAIQLAANGPIVFTSSGGINAGGCGGGVGGDRRAGGGGGAGGAILVEGPTVDLGSSTILAVNGGGGGGGDGPAEGATDGQDGKPGLTSAAGGSAGNKGGAGGTGGANTTLSGGNGDAAENGGGGAGGVGWIRINTRVTATIDSLSVVSPQIGTSSSTQGTATVR